jgi:hypothetical protein
MKICVTAERPKLTAPKDRHVTPIFLGAVAYSRKAPFTFVISIGLSIRKYQRGSHWMDFHEI